MTTGVPIHFEEKMKGNKALLVFAGLIVVAAVYFIWTNPNEVNGEYGVAVGVFAFMLLIFGGPLFLERNATIRVEDDAVVMHDKKGEQRIPFSSIRSVYRANFHARRGGAWVRGIDVSEHGSKRVTVPYRHAAISLSLTRTCVVLNTADGKLLAIPTSRHEELYSAIKSHLPV